MTCVLPLTTLFHRTLFNEIKQEFTQSDVYMYILTYGYTAMSNSIWLQRRTQSLIAVEDFELIVRVSVLGVSYSARAI
jgi:hypothetical protein